MIKRLVRIHCLLCLAIFILASNATLAASALPDLSWIPPDDNFDWIQLQSGEWLKGRIKALQNRELEFDSEELGDQTFEWKKIRQVRSSNDRAIEIKLTNGERLVGRITITPDNVTVVDTNTQLEPRTLPRDEMQSFTRGRNIGRQFWSGDASVGLTLRGGNAEQEDYTGKIHLQRRTPDTRWVMDYIGNRSTEANVERANNQRANSEFNIWQSQYFYWVGPMFEYFRDPFQNIDSRVTAGVGVGYDIIDQSKMEWNISTGPAFQRTRFASAQPNEPTKRSAGAWAVNSHFDWEINEPLKLTLDYRGLYTSREVGETTHHAVGALAMEVTEHFDIDLSLVWDRISNPKIGSDGIQPKPDDYRVIIGVKLDF